MNKFKIDVGSKNVRAQIGTTEDTLREDCAVQFLEKTKLDEML